MNDIEQSRLNDFKKILTYHIVSKICYNFKNNYELYYKASTLWKEWKGRSIKYSASIYKFIVAFNSTALSNAQRQHIFGRDGNGKYIRYEQLIENDPDIKVFNKGTIFMSKRRFPVKKRYQLPYEYIKEIFNDPQLLKKVRDAKSDFYSDRQRRLIFTQIIGAKHYHFKTNKEHIDDVTDEQRAKELIEEMFADGGLSF